MKASISKAVESLPPTTQIGLLTFSTVISVYDLSNPALLTADVIDGKKNIYIIFEKKKRNERFICNEL